MADFIEIETFKKLCDIRHEVPYAALLEQTAEECVELAHALLKESRYYRGENPTPMDIFDIKAKINEEFTDVSLCTMVLGLKADDELLKKKVDRWLSRLNESDNN